MKPKIRDAEVCIIKDGQILRGVDVYGELCIMIVDHKLMTTLAQESRRFRYDKKEKVLYLRVTGEPGEKNRF